MAVLHLWCKKDIAVLLDADERILSDIISTQTKNEIGFLDKRLEKGRYKKYTLRDVHKILTDVYPFKSEEERQKMLLYGESKGVK